MLKLIDWKKLAPIVIIFLVSLGLCIYALISYIQLSNLLNSGKERLVYIKDKTALSIENQKQIVVYDQQFETFQNQGYMGEPHRLQWIEVLRDTANRLQIPQIRFTLAPTVGDSLSDEDSYEAVESNLLLTPMRLEMELMHERDFYDFIMQYQRAALGVFQVDNCEIRLADENTTNERPIRLLATCQFTWLNYRDIRKDWEVQS